MADVALVYMHHEHIFFYRAVDAMLNLLNVVDRTLLHVNELLGLIKDFAELGAEECAYLLEKETPHNLVTFYVSEHSGRYLYDSSFHFYEVYFIL